MHDGMPYAVCLQLVRPHNSFSNFNEIQYVDRGR